MYKQEDSLVLERVVEDILNNSKFVVGTYDVESGGFPDVKVQRLSGINGYDNYHNNLGSAFVKTRGVSGQIVGTMTSRRFVQRSTPNRVGSLGSGSEPSAPGRNRI